MRTGRTSLVLSCLLAVQTAGAMAQGHPPQPQPAQVAQAPDLYAFTDSGGTYANAYFGIRMAFPTGWRMADVDDLKKADERRSAQELEAYAKQSRNVAELVKRGLIHLARSYVLMQAGDGGGTVIVIEARERTAPSWGPPGSCGEHYYQESGPGPRDKPLSELATVQYGGMSFAQRDYQIDGQGEPFFERILASCMGDSDAPIRGYYLVLLFQASMREQVQSVAEATLKSFHANL